jgi:hypothetical protein
MTTDEVVAAVEREYVRLLAAVEALGPGANVVAVTAEGWTAKDVVGHCIHWAGQLAFGLGAPMEVPAYVVGVEGRPTEEEWNAKAVAFYRNMSLDDVRARFDAVVAAVVDRARLRTDEEMLASDAIPWGGGRPLWEQIGGETFNHWPRHTKAIEAATRAT